MDSYKKTREVTIGGKAQTKKLGIGGNAAVSIQTMWKDSLINADLYDIARKLGELQQLGCDIVRFAVPEMTSADLFVELCEHSTVPLVADIHFDYRLALRCMEGAVAKIRINPGNIGNKEKIKAVAVMAENTGTAIRIGVNTGSLPSDIKREILHNIQEGMDHDEARVQGMVQTALREVSYFDELNFRDVIVSMKASSVRETILANELFAKNSDIPLHIGVTEAGPLVSGIVKSTIAFSTLLKQDIGATIRVSLSDSPENEIITAREILSECGKREGGVRLVSCPRCGRNGFDVHSFVDRWQKKLFSMKKDITVAIMGCVVNGPGEGKHADLGITGSDDSIIIFKKGEISCRLDLRHMSEEKKREAVDTAFEKELVTL